MGSSDEVRRLLDERGIKWWALESDPDHLTECVVDGVRIKFRQQGRGVIVSTCTEGTVTPEQAIAATVGAEPNESDKSECYLMYNGKRYPAVLDFGFLGLMPITIDVGGFRYLMEVPNEEWLANNRERAGR